MGNPRCTVNNVLHRYHRAVLYVNSTDMHLNTDLSIFDKNVGVACIPGLTVEGELQCLSYVVNF